MRSTGFLGGGKEPDLSASPKNKKRLAGDAFRGPDGGLATFYIYPSLYISLH